MSCIEIEGPQDEIMKGLTHVTSPDTGILTLNFVTVI